MSQSESGARRRSRRDGLGEEMEEEGPALRAKVRELAGLVRRSKYAVVHIVFILWILMVVVEIETRI